MHVPSANNAHRPLPSTLRLLTTVVAFLLFVTNAGFADKKVPTPEEILRTAGIRLATEDLIQALGHQEPVIRENAAKVIGARRILQAVPELKQRLADEYVFARVAAAEALLRLSDKSGMKVLQTELEGDATAVTVAAARALLAGGSTAGYPVLEKRLQGAESNWRDRVLVVRAVPVFRQPVGENPVRDLLIAALRRDSAAEVRRAAADELKQFQGAEVTDAFRAALKADTDPVVRGVAEAYLARRARAPDAAPPSVDSFGEVMDVSRGK